MIEWVLVLSLWSHNRETDEPKMAPVVVPGFTTYEKCDTAGRKIAERYGGEITVPWRAKAEKPTDYISFPATTIQCVEIEK